MKKTFLLLMALIISAGFAFSATTIPASSDVPGVHVLSQADGDPYSGANIIMGTDFSVWPWTSGPVAAFTPVKGGAYTMTFSFEATGDMNGMRVRWITDDTYGTNQADPLVEGMYGEGEGGPGRFTVSAADGTVADGLSAYFTTGGITNGSVLTYTVNFTMDDVEAFQNIGSIGIRGGSGSHAFIMNTIVIKDSKGNMLVNYDKDALIVLPPSNNVPGVHVLSQADGDPYSGANIITGTDFSVWPWTSGPEAAFTPVKGGAYKMKFSFEATGDMNGIRVRWITDDTYGTNQADPLVEGMYGEGEGGPGRFTVSAADGTVADGLSAYFTTGGITNGSVLTYTVNFTMDDVEAFQNIGSIGIRGGSGSHAFIMNTIVITDTKGNMLVNYDKDAADVDGGPISFDFEKNTIGDTYDVLDTHAETTIPAASVVANPAETDGNANSLYYKITAYDQVIILGTVNVPKGYTLADFKSIDFDVYTPNNQYKEILVKINDDPLWGNGIYKKISNGGSWTTISVNPTTGETKDADGNVTAKSGSKGGTSVYTDGSLTSFTFALGLNDNAIDYYLDNVVLTFSNESGIIMIKPEILSNAYGVNGGIIVNSYNEKVSVYSIIGRLVKQTVSAGNNTIIPVQQGIYIVNVGASKPVKVIVK